MSLRKILSKDLRDRIILIIGGVVITYATYYGYNITSTRQDVLKNSPLVTGVVSKITRKKGNKTIYARVDDFEINLGDAFNDEDTPGIGDTILLHYKPGVKYGAPDIQNDYRVMLGFEYVMFVVGPVLILLGLITPLIKKK